VPDCLEILKIRQKLPGKLAAHQQARSRLHSRENHHQDERIGNLRLAVSVFLLEVEPQGFWAVRKPIDARSESQLSFTFEPLDRMNVNVSIGRHNSFLYQLVVFVIFFSLFLKHTFNRCLIKRNLISQAMITRSLISFP
jgi:hypothetical protein